MGLPLAGVRIVELTNVVAGPIAGHVLTDLGAESIKVEQPRARVARPSAAAALREGAPDRPYNRVVQFNELHRGKRHIALDLAQPAARALFLELVAISDVVLENYAPRVLGNLGIDYATLREAKPDIVLVSMPAFGKTGPYATRGAYGPGIDAMSGLSHLTGYPDRGPGKPANFYCDQNAGLTAALATIAALRHRGLTGEGQYIELSMLEGELQLLAPALMDAAFNGREQTRLGNRHAWIAPHGVYRCRGDDAWVAIACEEDAQWRALCDAIERPDLAADERFATQPDRHANPDALDEAIEAWTSRRTHHEAQRLLQAAGVAAGALLDAAEVRADAQLRHREVLVFADHPEVGPSPHTRTAWRSRRGHDGVTGPAPLYGEATEYVLGELLSIDAGRRDALIAEGAVARSPQGGM